MNDSSNNSVKSWRPLQKMFTEVPARYDMMNRILTWRMDQRWRKIAAKECIKDNPGPILDLCTGTGDLAIHIAKMVNSEFEVYGLDYSEPMLEIARLKTEKKTTNQIQYQQGDAATMPFPDNSFSSIGIAFAFRNLTYKNPDRKKFLKEIYRALLLDGKFVIVETSHPRYLILRKIFHFYLKIFVAGLGGMLSGHRSAYSYLAASAIHFYKPGELKNLLEEAGFRKVNYKSLLGGIAGLTIALK